MTDQNASAGATPAVAGATPTQSPPATPAVPNPTAAPAEPAKGNDDALGDSGKRALEAERTARKAADDRAKSAEKERDELKAATQSDTEKAIAQAKKDGATETLTRVQAQIRRSEVRTALTAAGITATVLDLAVRADEFAALTVNDEGEVEALGAAVEAFRKAHPDLFTKPAQAGTADGGVRGGRPGLTLDSIKSMTPTEYAKRRDEVMEYLANPK